MTKSEEEQMKQSFETSTNVKSLEMFDLKSVGKQIKSYRNFGRLTELLILSTDPPRLNYYAVFPCVF